jgi:hypothetical protein
MSCPREGQQAGNMRGAQRSIFCHDITLHTPQTDGRSTYNAPQPLPATGFTLSVAYHTLPRSYQAALRDLRVEAVSITASATVYASAIMIPTLSFINSGQAHAVEAHLCLASARLLLGLNEDYSCISLMSQLMKWCQLRG